MSEKDEQKPKQQKPKPGFARKAGKWVLFPLVVIIVAAGILAFSFQGKEISAPDWLRSKITERINRDFSGLQVRFSDMTVVYDQNWVPRLALREVNIRDGDGTALASLSDLEGSLALLPLLKGQFSLDTIHLSGAQLKLRREADGAVGLSIGDVESPIEEASGFADLVKQLDDILLRPQTASIDRIEVDNLTVRYEDVRTDKAWTVDGGRLGLTRSGDDLQMRGDFALLGGRDYATTLEMNYTGRIGETAAEFGVSFEDMPAQDIAGQSPALTWLGALDAPISGALRASMNDSGALGLLSATLQIGEGVLQPTDATKPIAFSSARSYFTYDPKAQAMQFDELSLDSKWIRVSAEGKAFLVGIEQGWPKELLAQFQVSEIFANPDNLYAEPVEIEAATMDMRLQMEPFRLSLGELSFSDQGQRLIVKAEASAEPDGWDLAIDGRMDGITPKRLMELWPARVKDHTRDWIMENVKKANLSNIQLAVRSQPSHRPDMFLGFDFSDLETRFVKDVPPISGASGHASLYDERFVITTDKGHVTAAQGGRIDISGTSFIIPNVRVKRGPAKARLKTSSTITAALSLLDEKPFRFLSKANQPVTIADGKARVQGSLDFLLKPDLKPNEIAFDASGTLSGVRSETLVKDRVLVAQKLNISVDNSLIRIGGKGRLGRVPVQGDWQMPIGPGSDGDSTLSGKIELSERFTDEFRIGLPAGSVSGAGLADIKVTLPKGKPGRFDLSSNLAGIGLQLSQLSWSLSKKAKGQLEVSGTIGEPPKIDNISLNAGGLRAKGSVTLKSNGQLDRAVFSKVQVGTWLNAPVGLIGRGAGATPAVKVSGGTIDLRQTSLGGGRRGKKGGPVSLALDRLQISEGISLTGFKADLNLAHGVEGNFTGRVNGGTIVTGNVVPQKGRSAFRIRSKDAGGVFRSAGLLKQARNGDMDLVLTPATAKGVYNGRLIAKNFRLKDAPALAALLNALSVVGILEQMAGEGIHFARVDADFQLSPDRLTLTAGSAVGASMGISMAGYYFMKNGQMDMEGVISPLYLVNAVGRVFSRRGEGLLGFNYTLKGPASSPKVRVNPLSILTPGMFREIFRRPPPKVER